MTVSDSSDSSARSRRTIARIVTGALLTAGGVLVLAVPAFAETAEDPAPPLGLPLTLAMFVGVPVLAFGLIALLVTAPRLLNRTRTEDDLAWYREATSDDAPTDAPELTAGDSAVTPGR